VHDRRSIHVRLTDKGAPCATGFPACIADTSRCLGRRRSPRRSADRRDDPARLERFWIRASDLVQRPGQFAA